MDHGPHAAFARLGPPSLLRPGRVGMHIDFGRMRRPGLRAMLAYHYPGTDQLADDGDAALPDGVLTPAEVECAVIRHTELSDVLAALATAAAAAADGSLHAHPSPSQ